MVQPASVMYFFQHKGKSLLGHTTVQVYEGKDLEEALPRMRIPSSLTAQKAAHVDLLNPEMHKPLGRRLPAWVVDCVDADGKPVWYTVIYGDDGSYERITHTEPPASEAGRWGEHLGEVVLEGQETTDLPHHDTHASQYHRIARFLRTGDGMSFPKE